MGNGSKVWDFGKQRQVSVAGEDLLLAHWGFGVQRHPELRGPDFLDALDRVIELKTDTYSMAQTPNLFVERFSNRETETPGGPWQALGKGCTDFVYLFVNDRTWFHCSNLPALVRRLDALILGGHVGRPVGVVNRGWVTSGYRVPRKLLDKEFTIRVLEDQGV